MNNYLERRVLEVLEDFQPWTYHDILEEIRKDIKAKNKKLRSVKSAVLHLMVNYPVNYTLRNEVEYFQLEKELYIKQKELVSKAKVINDMAELDKKCADLLRDKYLIESALICYEVNDLKPWIRKGNNQ